MKSDRALEAMSDEDAVAYTRDTEPARITGDTCLTCGLTFRSDVLGPHIIRVHDGQAIRI